MDVKIFGAVAGTVTPLGASLLLNVVLTRGYGKLFSVFRKTERPLVDQEQHIIPAHPVDMVFIFRKKPEGRMFINNGAV